MGNFYNRTPDEVINKDDHHSGLKTKIVKFTASFSIAIYKGRYKVAYVYKSPYQRKYTDYKSLSSEKVRQELSELEFDATLIMETEEQILMHEYGEKFKEILSLHPTPSYPISTI